MPRYSYIARWKIDGDDFYEASEVTDALCDGQKSIVGKVRSQIMERYPALRLHGAEVIDVVLGTVPKGKSGNRSPH